MAFSPPRGKAYAATSRDLLCKISPSCFSAAAFIARRGGDVVSAPPRYTITTVTTITIIEAHARSRKYDDDAIFHLPINYHHNA